jgi:hypothetical protein
MIKDLIKLQFIVIIIAIGIILIVSINGIKKQLNKSFIYANNTYSEVLNNE